MLLLSDDLRRQIELARLVREESENWKRAGEPQLAQRLFKLSVLLSEAAITLRDLGDLSREG